MSMEDLIASVTEANPISVSEEYRTKRLNSILIRQGKQVPDYSSYDKYIKFNKKFKICEFPGMIERLNRIHCYYDSYDKVNTNSYIEDNFTSNNIEGAGLNTLNETLSIIQSGDSHKDKKSAMVIGYTKAVEAIKENKESSLDFDFCIYLNSIITSYYSDAEKLGIRDNSVYVGSLTEVAFVPCDCSLIPSLMELLFSDWLDSYDIFIRSAIMHFLFVWVHPFYDGNGRTARLILKEILIREGLTKFENISISKVIHDTTSAYYKAINNSEDEFDITHFIMYMLNVYEKCLTES